MDYYVYLMVRFVNGNEVSAHSEVLGPRIIKTPPGGRFCQKLYILFALEVEPLFTAWTLEP